MFFTKIAPKVGVHTIYYVGLTLAYLSLHVNRSTQTYAFLICKCITFLQPLKCVVWDQESNACQYKDQHPCKRIMCNLKA